MRGSLFKSVLVIVLLCGAAFGQEQIELATVKDTFGRSNERNQNSGGNETLYIARSSMLCALMAFDLSAVSNTIVGAELSFRQHDANEKPVSLVVAPMVHTTHNATWREGAGSLGLKGQNAQSGESTYSRSAFPDIPWENAAGLPVTGLGDAGLWKAPAARLTNQIWREGQDVRIMLDAVALLEMCRTTKTPIVTFGLWGTQGNGYYGIASKESGNGPKLILTLEGK